MSKKNLIKCIGQNKDGTDCEYKAKYFPVTSKNNLSKNRFCGNHWNQNKKNYYRWILFRNGLEAGKMAEIERRLKLDDESLDVRVGKNFTGYYHTSVPMHPRSTTWEADSTWDEREETLWDKVRRFFKVLKKMISAKG